MALSLVLANFSGRNFVREQDNNRILAEFRSHLVSPVGIIKKNQFQYYDNDNDNFIKRINKTASSYLYQEIAVHPNVHLSPD